MDNRVAFHVSKQLTQALNALRAASDHVNDTVVEDDELDEISRVIKSGINKVEFYLGKL